MVGTHYPSPREREREREGVGDGTMQREERVLAGEGVKVCEYKRLHPPYTSALLLRQEEVAADETV